MDIILFEEANAELFTVPQNPIGRNAFTSFSSVRQYRTEGVNGYQ